MPIAAGQAIYLQHGLPPHVGALLSGHRVPRADIAAYWVAMQYREDLELMEEKERLLLANKELKLAVLRHEGERIDRRTKAAQRDYLQQQFTYRYMKLIGLWSPLGILGAGCPRKCHIC